MRQLWYCSAIALASIAPAAQAQTPPAAATATSPVEPEATAAMDRMSEALRALPGFALTADVTNEVVLDTGQKIQYGGTLDIRMHKPDALSIVAKSDTQHREYYLNKGDFTIFAPRLNYYAKASAPPTIGAALTQLHAQYGIELPLADLFTWGTDPSLRARVKSGYLIRPETIGTRTCDHFAFRQEQVDWQIWIEQGVGALPCKIVITNTGNTSMPQYSAVLNWQTATPPTAADMVFTPPADAHRIALASNEPGEKK